MGDNKVEKVMESRLKKLDEILKKSNRDLINIDNKLQDFEFIYKEYFPWSLKNQIHNYYEDLPEFLESKIDADESDYILLTDSVLDMMQDISIKNLNDLGIETNIKYKQINNDDFENNITRMTLCYFEKNSSIIWENIYTSCEKMRDFLEERKQLNNKEKITNDFITEIDLSNTNAVQKIIYLKELGIIDLLRNEHCFGASVNNLANVLTAITGEKNTTLQPYLNALLSKTNADNKNPYNTESTVKKVKTQLINLGFKPK